MFIDLRYFAMLALFGTISTASTFAQNQCCVCKNGTSKFQIAQSTGCDIGCKSSGGQATGEVAACSNNAPVVKPGTMECFKYSKTLTGDCKGHDTCNCGVGLRLLMEQRQAFVRRNDYETTPVFVDELVTVLVEGTPKLHGGANLGSTLVTATCQIKFGDGQQSPCDIAGFPAIKHAYSKPGEYTLTLEATSGFRRDGECTFSCSSGPVTQKVKVIAAPKN